MSEDKISVGVLIIGSLYWDNRRHRRIWRKCRLKLDCAKRVRVPIRYGRCSSTRGYSYTMVFSAELADDETKMGEAIFVPCKRDGHTDTELIKEAETLWTAERKPSPPSGCISEKWGSVGLGLNPNSSIPNKILDAWRCRVKEKNYGGLESAEKEEPAVNQGGILSIPWPTCMDGSPLEADALLATATKPTLCNQKYPSPEQIADAWNTTRGREYICYFLNNKRVGITTFQDEKIEKYLRQALRQHPVTLEELSSICAKG